MRFPPPEVIASWPTPNYVNPQRRGDASVIVQSILVVLSTSIVFIRLYARLVITKARMGLDDVMILISWVFLMGLTATVILAIKRYGWDVHVWDLPPADAVTSRKISWVSMVLYITTASLTKSSILIFYRRILVDRVDKIITKVTFAFVIAYYLGAFLVLFLQCHPLQYYWEILLPTAKGTCINEGIHMTTTTAFNLLLDIAIFVIPLRTLFKLKIRTTQKIHLISLFSAGLLVVVAAAIRLYYVITVTLETYDVTWVGYLAWLWAAVEAHVSIICACVPSCRAFFVAWNIGSSKGGSRSATFPTGAQRSYNNIEEDIQGLTDRRMGTAAVVSARSRKSDHSDVDSTEEIKNGVSIQMEVFRHEEYRRGPHM